MPTRLIDNISDGNDLSIELNGGVAGDRESFLGLIVATMREGVWFLDADGITTYVNRSMASMLGWSEAEMLGRSLFDFMDEKAVQQALKYMDRRRSGISEIHEFRFRHRDGSDVWTTLSTRSLHTPSGHFKGTMATIQDITPQKLVEEELRSRKQQLRQMLDQLPLMTWSVDSDLRITSSYGSSLKLVELENDQLVGVSLADYLISWDQDRAEAMMSAHQRAIAGETVYFEIEFLNRVNFNIISPSFNSALKDFFITGNFGLKLDYSHFIEHKTNRTSFTKRPTHFCKDTPNFASSAISIISKSFNNYCHSSARITLIANFFKIFALASSDNFFYCRINSIFGHIIVSCLNYGITKTWIKFGVGLPRFSRHRNFANNFSKKFGFFGILSAFSVLDVCKL